MKQQKQQKLGLTKINEFQILYLINYGKKKKKFTQNSPKHAKKQNKF